jgi:hypothetical protein
LRPVCERALDTLEEAADKGMVTTAVITFNRCVDCAQIDPLRTCVSLLPLGSLTSIVHSLCTQTALSGLIHLKAMSQLEGVIELGDWEALITVSALALLLSVHGAATILAWCTVQHSHYFAKL